MEGEGAVVWSLLVGDMAWDGDDSSCIPSPYAGVASRHVRDVTPLSLGVGLGLGLGESSSAPSAWPFGLDEEAAARRILAFWSRTSRLEISSVKSSILVFRAMGLTLLSND